MTDHSERRRIRPTLEGRARLLAAIEATFGLLLFVRAFLPIASADRGSRWPAWTAIGFIAIGLVHFLVE